MKRTTPPKRPKWRVKGSPGDQLRRAAERNERRATRTLETQLAQALAAGGLR
ncbi:hypothetical protein [Hydrogenophaga intermedia]|uniref:hypothetical protein n=1 Tax=Hydrogenophaga intermedia TaxID=65786 RepID=UPI002044659D|nr:hypothetical protein [Hydrogenophaga intermedia]MCM3565195.1 hypothetical protein [Hydrogenophaga intermedia]